MTTVKIRYVVLGDGAVGKSCLIHSYTTNTFPQATDYVPGFIYVRGPTAVHSGKTYQAGLFDTASGEDGASFRPFCYPQTDAFIVCFSVAIPASFDNIRDRWFPELHHYCPGVPCVLVGTQVDLRDDPQVIERLGKDGKRPITNAQGERMALEMGAARYVECSALTRIGVKDVFDEVFATVLEGLVICTKRKRPATLMKLKQCSIL